MNHNLTEGNPRRVLWRYSTPMFLSVVFQQLYSIADSMIAGRFAQNGEDALAAIGASYPITMIFMAIAVGSNVGCVVVISHLFGARRYRDLKSAVSTMMIASLILSAALTGIGLIFNPGMMALIRTPDNIFADGQLYLGIYIGGFAFLFLYNVCTGIFQSLGDSKTPLYFLIGSSVGNIALDWLFVAVFHWDVAGVAWATFLAQGVACVLALLTLRRRIAALPSEGRYTRFSWVMLGQIARIAIPSILQQSFVSVGNILIQGLINSCGSAVIAGYSAAVKLNTFTITSFSTLSNGVSGFAAQNLGAGRMDRARQGYRAGLGMGLILAVPFFVVLFFFREEMIRAFMTDHSALALETGAAFLRMVTPFYFVIPIKIITDGMMRGAGAMIAFMTSTFSDLILRVALSFWLFDKMGTDGIWLSWPIGWVISTGVVLAFYISGYWKRKSAVTA
ncbi:MAG: MATE family efflux transporter [Acutalibacteraceae bacterium]